MDMYMYTSHFLQYGNNEKKGAFFSKQIEIPLLMLYKLPLPPPSMMVLFIIPCL